MVVCYHLSMTVLEQERMYKALANRRRLAIVKFLSSTNHAPVTDIAHYLQLSFKATSRHLQILKNNDIVEFEQLSKEYHYSLSKPISPIVKKCISLFK